MDRRARAMKNALADGCWKHASTFKKMFDWSPRECRIIRHLCKGSIVSGDRGYKLTMKATVEEVDRCTARLFKQADGIRGDALQIQRFFHRHKQEAHERG